MWLTRSPSLSPILAIPLTRINKFSNNSRVKEISQVSELLLDFLICVRRDGPRWMGIECRVLLSLLRKRLLKCAAQFFPSTSVAAHFNGVLMVEGEAIRGHDFSFPYRAFYKIK